jgi:hypothetical protein
MLKSLLLAVSVLTVWGQQFPLDIDTEKFQNDKVPDGEFKTAWGISFP